LKSKIINMADRLKDNEDRKLEALLRSEPLPDGGFSARVMKGVNRRIWVRRLALPIAFVAGAAVAVKPLTQLVVAFSKFLTMIPVNVGGLSIESIPQASTIILGGLLLVAIMVVPKILDA
jgi:hypothetical protein